MSLPEGYTTRFEAEPPRRPAFVGAEPPPPAEPVGPLQVVTVDEFADVDEQGADALLGDGDAALITGGGDTMFYGDGGAGKTTLVLDLSFRLAAGDPWYGIPIARAVKVLVVENEGPRPQFRKKLRRKRDGWAGSPVGDRLIVLEKPWSWLTLAEEPHREALAAAIREHAADVVVLGPVTRLGMDEAGTLQEVRDFAALLADVRARAGRPVAFILVHHENKGGKVSGAWEGAGDTLLHVQAQGHGRTRLYVQKARWSSSHHGTTLQLAWADGEGYTVAEGEPERDGNAVADEILAAVLANGGASWNTIDPLVTGKSKRKREMRDRLLAGGRLIDSGGAGGMKLWHADDPARPPSQEQLRPERAALGAAPAVAPGETAGAATAALRPRYKGPQAAGPHPVPPVGEAELTDLERARRFDQLYPPKKGTA